jgi:hypothetical protein
VKRDKRTGQKTLDAKTTRLVNKLVQSHELVAATMQGVETNLERLRSALLTAATYAGKDRLRFERRARKRHA